MAVSRRTLLQGLTAGSLSAAAASAVGQVAHAGAMPNILWIVSEDNNPFIGAYGDKIAHTPNIDALARRGVLFRNVYSSAPVCAPTRFGILTGVYPESCSPAQHMRAVAKLPAELRSYPEYMRSAGYYCTNNDKADYNCDIDPARIWDESGKNGHWRNRKEGQPFLAVFNYITTHESMLFSPAEGTEDFVGKVRIPAYLPQTTDVRDDYARYYARMAQMDAQVGQRIAEIEAAGLAEDTIIFYYSDNGGVLPRSKRYCYDEGHRVAMVAYVPPKWRHLFPVEPGSSISDPVNLIDLPPTLLSLVGIRRPPYMQGRAIMGPHSEPPSGYAFGMRNRMDERYDFVRTVTDGRWRYIRNYMPHRIWGMRGDFEWHARGYQSWEEEHLAGRLNPVQERFFQTKPFEELYDLVDDPDQVANLADGHTALAKLNELRRALDAHMIAIHDNGFIPEGSDSEGYAKSRDPSAYPLKRVMRLAQIAARGDVRKIGLLKAALSDGNGVVRYWAATGLLILGDKALSALEALKYAVATDSWPSVRVVSAEALIGLGEDATGLGALKDVLLGLLPFQPRLMALNALESIGAKALPLKDSLQALSDSENVYLLRVSKPLIARLEGKYDPRKSYVRLMAGG